ncbi:hypothetical protein F5X71_34755 [Nocardia brasiliensis]|uniref:Uncharacterized protein n=1 Tax=Nocardia brasiliensis TaxID=37326 RepID=A0A6G9Y137_NOCBR|nr:hypothetical protein [Nocardia brasiliensis]QIS06787.1 hypothetical protein F5X71_34755 [Nocardia brasiliensis]
MTDIFDLIPHEDFAAEMRARAILLTALDEYLAGTKTVDIAARLHITDEQALAIRFQSINELDSATLAGWAWQLGIAVPTTAL